MLGIKKNSPKIWRLRKKSVLLHRLSGRKVLMVTVVQLVRASDCGSECRGFESHQSPSSNPSQLHVVRDFFVLPLSSRFPSFPVVRRLLFGTMRLLQRDAGACRVLGFLPLLLSPSCPGCSVVVLFSVQRVRARTKDARELATSGGTFRQGSIERFVSR